MSYEGRIQCLCRNGHRFTLDAYSEANNCHCSARIVFHNDVDDTNGEACGEIPNHCWEQLIISPEEVEVCNLGHRHIMKEALYRPPTPGELIFMRYMYWDESHEMVPIYLLEIMQS